MKHKLTFFALLMLVITSMSFAQVTNLTHGGTGPYATITLAINNGATVDGDILSVAAGTYAETVVINKAITLRG
ncbi:MAG: hypothetical protein M1391_08110, partial [Bacteroidetes bacterium]|nr:hypothetical protein [Bacteroidota bacterium]